MCHRAGIARLILNGGFISDTAEPNDVDCVLLQGPSYNEYSIAAAELENGLPFLSMQIVRRRAFDELVDDYFATDREGVPKGVVEVIL